MAMRRAVLMKTHFFMPNHHSSRVLVTIFFIFQPTANLYLRERYFFLRVQKNVPSEIISNHPLRLSLIL